MRYLLVLLIPLILAGCQTTAPGTLATVSAVNNPKVAAIVDGVQRTCGVVIASGDIGKLVTGAIPYADVAIPLICQAFNSVAVTRGARRRNATVTVVIHGRRIRGKFVR